MFGIFLGCSSKQIKHTENTGGSPQLAIQQEIHNFGTLESGEIVNFSFKITNSGEGILNIDSVKYSCDCIHVDWPESGISAGNSTFVKITYDSSGEWGNVYQTIEIFSNALETKKNVYIAAKVNNQLFNQE